ncbi:MAG: aminotransferase class I/II-fold pyridoxal phosphate-dependent enzyme [Deltaproteobacteria bacterium]|nr:aminotransferase class I/II-fold pyridoxal phosphate-dependent enzyme [Deltaproteobacteria bacterium]
MTETDRLDAILARDAPAVARALSPLGRRAAFPRGIPWQSDQARGARINATIGQLTDGRGNPMPLDALSTGVADLDPQMTWLYAPVEGPRALRQTWIDRQRRVAGGPATRVSLPVVTHGLTHSLSVLASLFCDDDTTVLLPDPVWENYHLLFGLNAAPRFASWSFFRDGRLDVGSFSDEVAKVRGKLIVILNFPGNPSGYMPTSAEVDELVAALQRAHGPVVVVCDDAYQGWVYADDVHPRSLFWDLAERLDPEKFTVWKVDGATKELLFFSSRVGFLTHANTSGDAEDALLSKTKTIIRGTVGSPSGPAMALIQRGLSNGEVERQFSLRRQELGRRWSALAIGLERLSGSILTPFPFNGAFFALLAVADGHDPERIRLRLLHDHSVGVVAFPKAIRLAYCSLHADDIPLLVDRLVQVAE